jgi:hypothetical protein
MARWVPSKTACKEDVRVHVLQAILIQGHAVFHHQPMAVVVVGIGIARIVALLQQPGGREIDQPSERGAVDMMRIDWRRACADIPQRSSGSSRPASRRILRAALPT